MKRINPAKIILAPVISEKSTNSAENYQQYVFRVERKANKAQIRSAVQLMFEVEVHAVRTLNISGKKKRMGRSIGKRADWKKAYVKLKPGFDIDFASA